MPSESSASGRAPISRKAYRLGFWSAPVLTWSLYATYFAFGFLMRHLRGHATVVHHIPAHRPNLFLFGFLMLAGLMFMLGTAWASGMAAAFFWRKNLSPEKEKRAALYSVLVAWAPTAIYVFGWCVLWIPILAYWYVYRASLKFGKEFWFSPRARQWIGDFSTRDDDETA